MAETLAWLHSIDPNSIGLSGFGKKENFYLRHCNTFSRIEAQQAQVRDIKTGKLLGRAHPNFDEIVDFVRRNVPQERAAIVHGDFKFDNVILHPTEPRIIAILDWELSTIGHPLMDVVYLLSPYWISGSPQTVWQSNPPSSLPSDPKQLAELGIPNPEELIERYEKITGWDPRQFNFEVAKVFHLMRVSTFNLAIPLRQGQTIIRSMR
jgi:aminoglycoside phosphotransferase (APT) family kinase protein